MVNVVLLDGVLHKEKLERAFSEIEKISDESHVLTIVLNSTEGNALAAVDFVEKVSALLGITCLEIKVYEAKSTAAFILLALSASFRKLSVDMRDGAVLGIHRGEIRLSPTQISPDGRIDESLSAAFKKYDAALIEALHVCGLKEITASLYATDWLYLLAQQCLDLGIVTHLF